MKRLAYTAGILLSIGGSFFLLQKSFSHAETDGAEVEETAGSSQETTIETSEMILSDEESQEEALPIIPVADADADATAPAPTPSMQLIDTEVKEDRVAETLSFPAQVLDLASWKQTLPTGSSKKPTEIKQGELATFSDKACFHVNEASNGVVFRAPVNGVTTSGSGYPRSELREMKSGGKELASWSTASGTHTMIIDQAITAVPEEKKHVVAGQIHDADDDVIVVRLEYPKLFVDIGGKEGPTLDPNYALGERFTVKFVAEGGKIKIYYNGGTNPVYTMDKKTSGCYFKAGAYTQSNCSKESECSSGNYGEVVIYDLDVSHSNV